MPTDESLANASGVEEARQQFTRLREALQGVGLNYYEAALLGSAIQDAIKSLGPGRDQDSLRFCYLGGRLTLI